MKIVTPFLTILICFFGVFIEAFAICVPDSGLPPTEFGETATEYAAPDAIPYPIKVGIDRGKNMYAVYAIGDAVPGKIACMNPINTVLQVRPSTFEWTGYLQKGYLRFILQSAIQIALTPDRETHEEIIPYYFHTFTNNNRKGDSYFFVTEEGEYTIKLDMNGKYGKSIQLIPCESQHSGISIVGDVTSGTEARNKAASMSLKAEGFYEWTGFLHAGRFKFITQSGAGSTLVPAYDSDTEVSSYCQYPFSNLNQGDHYFDLKHAGYYTISLDMYTRNFNIYPAGSQVVYSKCNYDEPKSCNDFRAIAGKGYVRIRVAGRPAVQTAQLVNLDGRTFSQMREVSNGFVLGNKLPKGSYVVYIRYDDNQVFTQKVNVR